MAVAGVTIVLGFVRSILLMRLLAPDEFGYVALALFFMMFLTPLSSLGIDGAVIQHQRPGNQTFSTHFVIRLALALLILALGLLLSPLLRRFYADQGIVVDILLVLLAANVVVAAFSTHGIVLRRDLRFGWMAFLNLLSSLVMTVTTPVLAYLGLGVWSLVAEQVIGPLVRGVVLWVVVRPWRLSLRFDRTEARSLLAFGRHVFSSHALGILLDRFDDFWVGTALGPTALGYYSRAYEIARYPKRVLATPITNVFLPTYSSIQQDEEGLSKAFFRSSSILVRIGLLVAVVLVAAIPEITLLLFGGIWLPIVPIFRFMVVYVTLDPLYVNLSYLFVGTGRPERVTRVRLAQVVLFVAAVVVSSHVWGVLGVAIAADLMMVCGTVALLASSRKFVTYSLWRMVGWPLIATVASAVAGYGLASIAQSNVGLLFGLLIKTTGVSAVYALVLYLAEKETLERYGSEMVKPLWVSLGQRLRDGSAWWRKAL
jgi:O-antigen/teichoic acid export membrane protein